MGLRYSSRKENRAGRICITIIVLATAGVMSLQIVDLYQRDRQFAAQEADLDKQKEEQESRQKELEEYEAYTKTQEYIEDTAKSRLGFVYEDEIIFKEQ